MAQHGFPMGGHNGNAIDPNDLMSGDYQQQYQNNFQSHGNQPGFSSGSALFGDDELLDGLGSPSEPQGGMPGHGQNFGGMSVGYTPGIYSSSHHGLPMEQGNGYSNTPDGDPIASPFVHNFASYRPMQHPQSFGGTLQSPLSYGGSPMANSEMNTDADGGFLGPKSRPRLQQTVQRKPSSARSPLTPKAAAMASLSMGSDAPFGSQPIQTARGHEKSHSGQWMQTPNSLSSFPGSGFSSPMQPVLHSTQINDLLLKGGTSMPAKLGTGTQVTSQEAKRKRRRESHNLVERRRRDNINERIQDLSKLVPAHRLEDEKIRKALQNGTPLSPSLAGISSPTQATSALAGPGARRAAGGTAGNITTGLPIEDKDKGPNKGDILNGAVSWTRDLMWMLHLKLQQQEELINALLERGGAIPFEVTEDEKRMQTELMEAMAKDEDGPKVFNYSRRDGSGLRVPHHTNYKGEPLNGNGHSADNISISPDGGTSGDMLDAGDFLDYDDEVDNDMNFKEEDEYAMELN
ncbi:microphthalmia-associated transcription factor [Echria macrotheca]|uniref:Microphthalmia-associated transcription factor n=1 Tax=Echria macrotheca TaxID=438768 RepID=A0AAJ0BGQ9_9PEZI|nr:microphthalmia-associated transcription factor [Echria macrotheca]